MHEMNGIAASPLRVGMSPGGVMQNTLSSAVAQFGGKAADACDCISFM